MKSVNVAKTLINFLKLYDYSTLHASFLSITKFNFKYSFFIFKWNSKNRIFKARASKRWLYVYLFKCLISTAYFCYQLTNIHMDFIRKTSKKKLSSTIVIDYFWVLWSFLPFYHSWYFFIKRQTFLSSLNTVLNLKNVGKRKSYSVNLQTLIL